MMKERLLLGNPFNWFGLFAKTSSSTSTTTIDKNRQKKKKSYYYDSKPAADSARKHHRVQSFEKTPLYLVVAGYLSYLVLNIVGYFRELVYGIGPIHGHDDSKFNLASYEKNLQEAGYAPLYSSKESFYARNVFRRLKDIFNQPIASVPGAEVTLIARESNDDFWSFKMNEKVKKKCINFGSYNYLGFAETEGTCSEQAIRSLYSMGLATCSTRQELGNSPIHQELERTVAKFLGVDDAITLGMGFATNTMNLPQLMGKDCLVLSDEFNHASIILGLRLSGASVVVFKHNNMKSLEECLKSCIIKGNPITKRSWKKIFIVVEGIYSMEGSVVNLPEIIKIKKKYRAFLYLDEAHSVGAMGQKGRGIVDYFGLSPKDVDIMMGTFTKSFGSCGGYIAGSKGLISYLRIHSQGFVYPTSMSPAVAQQIITAMNSIMNPSKSDGLRRVRQLARNSKYFRRRLQQMGFLVYGHDDSPVVPLLLFMPGKCRAFVLECLKHNIATVGVGFPATKIAEERARFCISAGHTKEMIDYVLRALDVVGDYLHIKYSTNNKFEGKVIKY